MKKGNKIILTLIIIFSIVAIVLCIYSVIKNKKEETDAIKFRNEYMELNDKINDNNGKEYVNTLISEKNTVKYASEKDIIKLLTNGTGIIYFGFSKCPWCRTLVSTLTEVGINKNETIYYLDILNIRSSFELSDGSLEKIKEGTKDYYKIVDLLSEYLEEYYLTDLDGNKFDTTEKRLYAPTVVAVKNGEIVDFHVGTVDSQKSGYDKLSESEQKELEEIIEDLFDSVKGNNVCTQEKC